MSVQAPVRTGHEVATGQVAERKAWSTRGVRVLVLGAAILLAGIVLLILSARQSAAAGKATLIVAGIILLIVAVLAFHGLTTVVAGEARVVQLFGRYRGTIRAPGLQWVNPFSRRRRVSTRLRNRETAMAKVNDADGHPIEIAAVVVWQALQRLEDEDVVELDEERKAAMVSNLLVVLCSEQATQQVVNTGSLYQ
jgi:SPFH domain / Band 7 family